MKAIKQAARCALGLFFILAATLLLCGAARAGGLTVHFIDLDRNDGIVIECDGEFAFIDGGNHDSVGRAVEYMQSLGVRRLKYYIGTHAHKNHVGGASEVLVAFPTEAVLQPHDGVQSVVIQVARSEEQVRAANSARYVTVSVGQTYAIGHARLTILAPVNITRYREYTSLENGNSIMCRLTYGDHSFLLTGDAMKRTIADTDAAFPGALKCDVLKNPHHNAYMPSDLLASFAPKYVVFSTSDHYQPSQSYLREVADVGAQAMITSPRQNGTIVFRSDGHTLSYTVSQGPSAIRLNRSELTVYEGKQQFISARQTPSSYRTVRYYSLDESIAVADARGRVVGVSPGTVIVRAQASNGLYDDCAVTVLPVSISLNREALTIRHGDTAALRASLSPSGMRGVIVAWSSDQPAVVSVSDKGKITGVMPGEATVRATLANGSQAACRVTVTPVPASSVKISPGSPKITFGQTQQLTAAVLPKNATDKSVTWSSEDESVARVDQNGLVTAVGVGRAQITAETANGKSRSVSVTVKPVYITGITLSSDCDTLTEGVAGKNTLRLHAAIQPQNATIQDIEWKSSNPWVATVDETGLVTAVNRGRVTIYALAQDGGRCRGVFHLNVVENRFTRRSAVFEPGRLVVSAKQLSYRRDSLNVELFYANGTEERVPVPAGGVLTLILPDGSRLPVMPMEVGRSGLRKNGIYAISLRLPLASYPQLAGLDLASCDATVN